MADGDVLPTKNRGLIIAVGAGLVLAFLYILTRRGPADAPSGDGTGMAIQNLFNSLTKAIEDAVAALRKEFEDRFTTIETGLAASEAEIERQAEEFASLESRVSTWQDLIDALTQSIASAEGRLGQLEEEQTGLGSSMQQSLNAQMLNTAKTLYLSLERGSQDVKRLKFLKRYVLSVIENWNYPQEVIDEFIAWVDPHIIHSSTGVRPEGFTGGALSFLNSFYGARPPRLDRAFDVPISAAGLTDIPIRGRYGKKH